MAKLTALIGLPASGKSTAAKELVRKSGYNKARINRDDLRAMLYDSNWSRDREKHIIGVEKAIARYFLDNKIPVVLDDTNFKNPWPEFVKNYNQTNPLFSDYDTASYEEVFIDTPLEECIRRDALRDKSVGRNVITKMALRNGLVKFPDLPVVLVDIDGTLARSEGRERHLKGEKKDWKSYYNELESDSPVLEIFKWVSELSKDHTIIIVSGRGAEWENRTIDWFNSLWNGVPEGKAPYFPVFLWLFRDSGDRREDYVVKSEILDLLPVKPKFVIDDRPCVVEMWRERGIMVIPVAGECEDF